MSCNDFVTQRGLEVKRNQQPQYEEFFNLSEPGFIIPGLHQDLIPQGFAYLEEKDWLFMSYYCDDDGRSAVSVVDAKTNIFLKAIFLSNTDGSPYTEHAGGLAVNSKYLWVSSDSTLYYMDIEKVFCASSNSEVSFDGTIPVDVNGSFTKVTDNILWVGEFAHSTNYTTKDSHHMKTRTNVTQKAWVTGYELDPKTKFFPEDIEKTEDDIPVPDYILSIPYRIQGLAVQKEAIILSESYGRTADSHLLVFKNPLFDRPHQMVEVGDTDVPLWLLDDLNHTRTFVAPPMAESIAQYKQSFYVLFESGAEKYRDDGSYPLERAYKFNLPLPSQCWCK